MGWFGLVKGKCTRQMRSQAAVPVTCTAALFGFVLWPVLFVEEVQELVFGELREERAQTTAVVMLGLAPQHFEGIGQFQPIFSRLLWCGVGWGWGSKWGRRKGERQCAIGCRTCTCSQAKHNE